MAKSRKTAWLRDELILALDLYVSAGRNPSASALDELSALLREMPIEEALSEDSKFRGRQAVYLKLANFAALDPSTGTKGMTRMGQSDREVWNEFASDPERLSATAAAIRSTFAENAKLPPEMPDSDITEALEGQLLTRSHRTRERNRKLVERRKAETFARTGKLECEVCGFDFAAAYGERGEGFIECHHTIPLHSLKGRATTRVVDLALVCPNCHRMIHRTKRWLSVEQVQALVQAHKEG
jgi:5-methylcytosine-specific restriction protein A